MARSPRRSIEKAMPGYRLVELPKGEPRGLESGRDDTSAAPSADLHGPDFAKLQELYLGKSTKPQPRSSGPESSAFNSTKLFTVEKHSLMDTPEAGRKTVLYDEENDTVVGRQG